MLNMLESTNVGRADPDVWGPLSAQQDGKWVVVALTDGEVRRGLVVKELVESFQDGRQPVNDPLELGVAASGHQLAGDQSPAQVAW